MRLLTVLSATLLCIAYLMSPRQPEPTASQVKQGTRHRVGDPDPTEGIARMTVEPAVVPRSLTDLVRYADVIVDGMVEIVQPSRRRDPADPTSLETDAILAVERVLKGHRETLRKLVITQLGGQQGNLALVPAEYELLRPGDRHILFLTYDKRPIVPLYPGVNGTFEIVGIWSGNFKVANDVVKVSPQAAPELKRHDAETVDVLTNQILSVVRTGGR